MSHEVLTRLYQLSAHQQDQAAVEVALEYVERELRAGRFSAVDKLMRDADTTQLRAAPLLAIVTMTKHGQDNLTERASFLMRAARQMIEQLGADRTMKLLEHRR